MTEHTGPLIAEPSASAGWKYSQASLLWDIGGLLVGQRRFIRVKCL
jgi:hypothetical protein